MSEIKGVELVMLAVFFRNLQPADLQESLTSKQLNSRGGGGVGTWRSGAKHIPDLIHTLNPDPATSDAEKIHQLKAESAHVGIVENLR